MGSEIYDNWERLVNVVLRKEELWALFHAPSRSTSLSSEISSDFSSSFTSGTFGFHIEIEELQSSDFRSSLGSCLQIEELTIDECVRSSNSRDDQKAREIVPVPHLAFFCFPFLRGIFQHKNEIIFQHNYRALKVVLKLNLADDKTGAKAMKRSVLKLNLADDKTGVKAMKRAAGVRGVEKIRVDMKDKKIIVVGDVDAVALARSLRKLCLT